MTSNENTPVKHICLQCRAEFDPSLSECPVDGSLLIPSALLEKKDPLIGTTISNRYELLEVAGKGGMGVVYKARHLQTDRIVAVKMLKQDGAIDEQTLKRFQLEARAASKLQHPNVVPVYDCGLGPNGQPYLVMDFISGDSLSYIIARDGYIDFRRAIPIIVQSCNALEHAHRQQIIHRDIKPSNIVLLQAEGQSDFVKVVDFGIAKITGPGSEGLHLTTTGEVLGSPLYMSPEQCKGESLDHRTDIYSLGASIYEMLLGVPPIRGKSIVETFAKQVSQAPVPFKVAQPNISVPESIESVVMKALEKDCSKRFSSMLEMKEAIEAAMRGKIFNHSYSSLTTNDSAGNAIENAFRSSMDQIPPTQFNADDLQKQLQRESDLAKLKIDNLKAKGKKASFLAADKEGGAEVQVTKLKSSLQDDRPKIGMMAIAVIVFLIVGAAYIWFFVLGGMSALQKNVSKSPYPTGTQVEITKLRRNANQGKFKHHH